MYPLIVATQSLPCHGMSKERKTLFTEVFSHNKESFILIV